jgi:hypothetical protein
MPEPWNQIQLDTVRSSRCFEIAKLTWVRRSYENTHASNFSQHGHTSNPRLITLGQGITFVPSRRAATATFSASSQCTATRSTSQQFRSEIMKIRVVALIAGLAAAGFTALRSKNKTRISRISTTTLDLNTASTENLTALGLDAEAVDRIVDNRPYRRKLELLERFILAKPDYDLIRQRISTDRSHANDGVRVAS